MSGFADAIGAILTQIANPTREQNWSTVRTAIQGASVTAITTGVSTGAWPLAVLGGVGYIGAWIWGQTAHTNVAKIEAAAAMTGPEKAVAFTKIPDAVKLQAVEAIPAVKAVLIRATVATDGVADAMADPARPKVQAA
jgi:hypothetical protein